MTRVLRVVVGFCAWLAVLPTFGQQATITETESLVRVVLKLQKIQLASQYCELERLDKNGKSFVSDYYSFSAHCDYPNTAATNPFGIYVVSPRTGDVWEYNRCEWFRFPELSRLQRNLMKRTHATDATEAKYREASGCTKGK
jgi:hypothetical protein